MASKDALKLPNLFLENLVSVAGGLALMWSGEVDLKSDLLH